MSDIDKMRWQQMASTATGFATLLGIHKGELGFLNRTILAGAASHTALITQELSAARIIAPVEAGDMAAAGLHLAHSSGLNGEPKTRITTEALCTLKSLHHQQFPAAATSLQTALSKYGDVDTIADAHARGVLRGVWQEQSQPQTAQPSVHTAGTAGARNSPLASVQFAK